VSLRSGTEIYMNIDSNIAGRGHGCKSIRCLPEGPLLMH
jgi:hypothetical protein